MSLMNGKLRWIIVGLLLASACPKSWATPLLRSIVLTGEQIPGVPDKTYQSSGAPPTINNLGQIAFHAYFDSPNYSHYPAAGIWTNSQNPNGEMIVSEEEPVPGAIVGSRFSGIGAPKLNDLGQIAFTGSIGIEAYVAGVWLFDDGDLIPIAVRNQHPPAFEASRIFYSFSEPILSNSTGLAFYADARQPDPYQRHRGGIWSFQNGSLELVVEASNQFAPEIGRLSINDSNALAISARLSPGAPWSDSGIWIADGKSLTLIMQEASNYTGGGDFVEQNVAPSINSQGRIAFAACTSGSYPCARGGVWVSDGESVTPLVTNDQSVSIDERTYTFQASFSQAAINDQGTVAFAADFVDQGTGLLQRGVWVSSNGNLRLLANVTDGLRGVEPGNNFEFISGIALNNRGQVAFKTGRGIWATDLDGIVRPIATLGEVIDLDEGPGEDLRIIRDLDVILNGQRGSGSGFNDRGEVAFAARFAMYNVADGIFISSAVAVPEAANCIQIMFAALIVASSVRLRKSQRNGFS